MYVCMLPYIYVYKLVRFSYMSIRKLSFRFPPLFINKMSQTNLYADISLYVRQVFFILVVSFS